MKQIKNAIISVYHKDGLLSLVQSLVNHNIKIYSTGGTFSYFQENGIPVESVENLTRFPAILGGRVKTLHPAIFGGILARRFEKSDLATLQEYQIPEFDLVIVDLYPFEETVNSGATEQEIIEKIDIGGISLLRAAAKNFRDVTVISNNYQYEDFLQLINEQKGQLSIEQRKEYALEAFEVTADYDATIYEYFCNTLEENVEENVDMEDWEDVEEMPEIDLRYGENPHQKAKFFGDFDEMFTKLHGKEISYNNLLDIDAAVHLMADFNTTPTFAILKHNNACGCASRNTLLEAWEAALSGDPTSAFGGVLITNRIIDKKTAVKVDELFFEVIIAPQYEEKALEILQSKKNRIILVQHSVDLPIVLSKSLLNGYVEQECDRKVVTAKDCTIATSVAPTTEQMQDLLFANIVVKHSKSNAIVLVKNQQLIGSGVGQTSRIDALKQAIGKAKQFGFETKGSVMASDAFFPFSDCVEIAHQEGVVAIIQPGGSIRDKDSIDFCNQRQLPMIITGFRHFKH